MFLQGRGEDDSPLWVSPRMRLQPMSRSHAGCVRGPKTEQHWRPRVMSHIKQLDHVGITGADLDSAASSSSTWVSRRKAEPSLEGAFVDDVIGIPDARTEIVVLRPAVGGERGPGSALPVGVDGSSTIIGSMVTTPSPRALAAIGAARTTTHAQSTWCLRRTRAQLREEAAQRLAIRPAQGPRRANHYVQDYQRVVSAPTSPVEGAVLRRIQPRPAPSRPRSSREDTG